MAEREYVGAVHVHSNFSDGSSPVSDIIAAATDVGLDFLVMSDHNSDNTALQGLTGWHDGMLCLSAPEIGARGNPHFLAFGLTDVAATNGMDAPDAIEEACRRGAENFIAHPHVANIRLWSRKPAGWTYWDTDAFCGIEIWSYMHDVCHNAVPWRLPILFFRHRLLVSGPRPETLQLWDRLCRRKRIAALGSLDNHATRKFVIRKIFPHKDLFRTLRTHVICEPLPADGAAAIQAVTRALIEGSSFVAMDAWADSSGFGVHVDGPGGTVGLGQETTWSAGMRLHVRSPRPALLSVVRDGRVLERRRQSSGLELPIDVPGVYRIEGHLGRRPWVFTNPIYLREG